MYVEPADLDRGKVRAALAGTWGLQVVTMDYLPVGFGSHHYSAMDQEGTKWFVTLDDLEAKAWIGADPRSAFDVLDRAFRTAAALRDAGLEFVHAPIESKGGVVLAPVDDRYAATLFPFIEGTSGGFHDHLPQEDRRRVLRALGRMHAAAIPTDTTPRRDTLAIPRRAQLVEALGELDNEWAGGPFSEPARALLAQRRGAITALLDQYDELTHVVLSRPGDWVVTHGEPHGGNVMRGLQGELHLIDWDTVAIAPRERDLWMIEPRDDGDWAAYTSSAPAPEPDPAAITVYRSWWQLTEIAVYTHLFRGEHQEDANTQVAWRALQSYLPNENAVK